MSYLVGETNNPTPPDKRNTPINYPHMIDTSELTEDDKKDVEDYINYLKFRRKAIEMNEEFSAELQPRFN